MSSSRLINRVLAAPHRSQKFALELPSRTLAILGVLSQKIISMLTLFVSVLIMSCHVSLPWNTGRSRVVDHGHERDILSAG